MGTPNLTEVQDELYKAQNAAARMLTQHHEGHQGTQRYNTADVANLEHISLTLCDAIGYLGHVKGVLDVIGRTDMDIERKSG
jgi:hypothetical protein